MSNALELFVRQSGGELLPDQGDGWINRFQIKSETSNRLYTVSQNTKQGNRWECSCPAWRTKRTCKHLTAMVPELNRLVAPPPKPAATWPVLAAPQEAK